ncbi:MAG: undecaprenyl-phosphate galactose phosphotransferase WbaP [Anaerolineaceae bacterium]
MTEFIASTDSEKKEYRRLNFFKQQARFFMGVALVLTDFIVLMISGFLGDFFGFIIKNERNPIEIQTFFPYFVALILVYFLIGLYSPGVSPVNELRRLFISTTIVFLFFLALFFWLTIGDNARFLLMTTWVIAVILLPVSRSVVRKLLASFHLWGEPVAIIGFGQLGYKLVTYLLANPMLGFTPYLVIDRRKASRVDTREIPKEIMVKSIDDINEDGYEYLRDLHTAILVTSEIPGEFYESITDIRTLKFSRLIVVSIVDQTSNLWMQPYDIGGIIGLEVGLNLINNWQQAVKRVIDLFLILISLPVSIPILLFIAGMVAIDSKGPVFYSNYLIGKKGKLFRMWKFRTMHPNADQILPLYLEQNPDLHEEWITNHKLKNDPRITRVGRFLRKYSLDELPQIWNVVLGEMSLVGPRPISIMERDNNYFGKCFNLYIQVRPGITGLWQVSGRSDTSYVERVRIDEYYVRNWSVWLDVIILARTPVAVFLGKGAY